MTDTNDNVEPPQTSNKLLLNLDFNAIRTFADLSMEAGNSLSKAEASGSEVDALNAARFVLPELAEKGAAPHQTAAGIAVVCAVLGRLEHALRATEEERENTTGGRPLSPRQLDFSARAVFAVKWLQELKLEPASREDALAAVEAIIPVHMRSVYNHHKRSPAEQLAAWIDAFSRAGDARRQRALANAAWDADQAFLHCEREETEKKTEGGPPSYGELITRDMHDATRGDVLAWVREALN